MQRRMRITFIALCLLLGFKTALFPTRLNSLLASSWTMTGNLNTARSGHTATLLPNGKVLVFGGYIASGTGDARPLRSAELYDPATGMWTFTGSAFYERNFHTATLLPNGRVLVAGGGLKSVELYDPATGQWYATGPLQVARLNHTATLLPNGKVLVAGGGNGNIQPPNDGLDSTELYDPITQVWTLSGSLNVGRFGHRATLLSDGQVLVVGGSVSSGSANSAELYDAASGIWTLTSGLFYDRPDRMHTATSLRDGRALVAGGKVYDSTGRSLDSVEMYNSATGGWYSVGPLNTARRYHAATLLSDGKVLVAGGLDQSEAGRFHLKSAEIFDPVSLVWTATADLNVARSFHTMTLLLDGKVLVAGGDNATSFSNSLNSAELFDSGPTCSTITIYPAALRPGAQGTAYSQTFTQTGSSGRTVWSASARALPRGLRLDSTTGVLSGTLTTKGTFRFTVRAFNGNCFGKRVYTLEVKALSQRTVGASSK